MVALERSHYGELTEDASDRIWSLVGQIGHNIIERADIDALVKEERLSIEVGGWKVSGQMDRLATYADHGEPVLEDYKFTSVWAVVFGRDEWEQQLNVYAAILRENGYDVGALRIVAILRDWNKREAQRKPDYPQAQVQVIPQKVWDHNKAMEFIDDRVLDHQAAREAYPHEMPECSDEDRWAKPDTWAVMKEGRKTALRVLSSEMEAYEWCGQNDHDTDPKISVVHRPGENVRCENYCAVKAFCPQYERMKNGTDG